MALNVLDLFCGCGGLSYGFKLAGYNIVGGIDINENAIDTFNHNFKNAKGVCCDLSTVEDKDIPFIFENINDVDIVIGGPPCQGFSTANRYQHEEDDPRNKLFFEFIKFVKIAKPRAIVIENVRGIITRNNGYAKDRIYEIFQELGYNVTHAILDASDYGVPQRRLRNFFVATLDTTFEFESIIKSKNKIFVKEAIGELYCLENKLGVDIHQLDFEPNTEYQKYLRASDNMIHNHLVKYPAEIVQKRISYVPQGGNWRDVPQELFKNNRNNRHSSAYKRLNENDFSVTIDTGNAHSNYFHPLYNRIPTVREAARLQSFPDEFIFMGSRSSQYRQVGNAVPPLLSKAIAKALMEVIK
ncbi:MAG: (cytosine-5)-methyltransferase 1 [Clostridiales bacterium]|jgi:DNA (cytosine-5)-methyltransferase 1|nr:(cytosine-5)-methyltransferase 1 [Clostridiales bacterium]